MTKAEELTEAKRRLAMQPKHHLTVKAKLTKRIKELEAEIESEQAEDE